MDGHVANLLREADRDRYISTLYAAAEKRAELTALYAFNAEIAAVRDRIRDPMAGEVRLQWWRDAIAAGAPTGNPVADALIEAVAACQLPVSAFERMLEARIFDLYDDPMPDRTTLEGYCGETASALIQLALMILDRDAAPSLAGAAGHAGCAQAITGLLRLLPLHRARGQCYLPGGLLASAGTSPAELIAGDNREAAARAISATIALAREHWSAFERQAKEIPQGVRPAFLPLAPIPAYLRTLGKGPEAAFDKVPGISGMRVQLVIGYRALWGW
ncbi:MAG: phytoene/squalene synthase family protein [Rhizobiaceae bacterium]|nr:phytoene/squalene synthase family protein [Rhizobiaceae bacterium]